MAPSSSLIVSSYSTVQRIPCFHGRHGFNTSISEA